MDPEQRNWAGNLTYGATAIHRPTTVEEVRAIVAGSARVRAVGARHSFNAVADTDGDLLSLAGLNRIVAIDPERQTATVEGGMRYANLGPPLHDAGFALHNLASLPQISVAGACATATHGSGDGNGALATAVSALEIVTADGDLVTLSRERDGDRFLGAVVGLGALGIVVRVTLDLQPTFAVGQVIYENLPLETALTEFDAVMGGGYSVSLFTDWQGDTVNQVWVKRRVPADSAAAVQDDYFGARPATDDRRPSGGPSAGNLTMRGGIPGPWHERLPHFRPNGLPERGAELQTEYFVPREHAPAAMRAIAALGEQIAPLLIISEVRSVAADELWMSPFYRQPGVGLHFTWRPDWTLVGGLLPAIEESLAPFAPRPHWGKLALLAPGRVAPYYPRLGDFRALVREFDPRGKFRNAFLDRYVLGEG